MNLTYRTVLLLYDLNDLDIVLSKEQYLDHSDHIVVGLSYMSSSYTTLSITIQIVIYLN